MLDNALNLDDLRHLLNRLKRQGVRKVARQAVTGKDDRINDVWSTPAEPPIHAWDVPGFLERQHELITGDRATSHVDYFVDRYLGDRTGLVGLSVGCGEAWREEAWANTGRFATIHASDLSLTSIASARRRIAEHGLSDVLELNVANAFELDFGPGSFDVIIGEDALHHMSPLDDLFARFDRWLRPDGFLFVNEYVGPRRLQMSERQVEAANALLTLLPETLRGDWHSGGLKRRVARPGRVRVYLKDPSEAVESDRIVPLLRERFDVIEEKPFGGTIAEAVITGIAQNFRDGDPQGEKALDLMFLAEGLLLEAGEIASIRSTVVCRKRQVGVGTVGPLSAP